MDKVCAKPVYTLQQLRKKSTQLLGFTEILVVGNRGDGIAPLIFIDGARCWNLAAVPGIDAVPGDVPQGPVITGDRDTQTVIIPFDLTKCDWCDVWCQTAARMEAHVDTHDDKYIQFGCGLCGKKGPHAHGAGIHNSLCTGIQSRSRQTGHIACTSCKITFSTESGLSQHKRHAHPEVRNDERIMAKLNEAQRKRAKRAETRDETKPRKGVWTDEEIEQLHVLCKKFEGERFINKLIEVELVTKTNRQISDRRRTEAKKALTDFATKAPEANPGRTEATKALTRPATKAPRDTANPRARKRGKTEPTPPSVATDTIDGSLFIEWLTDKELSRDNPERCEAINILTEAIGGTDVTDQVENLMKKLTEIWTVDDRINKKPKGKPTKARARSIKGASEYRRVQELFKRDKKRLATEILDGKVDNSCPVEVDEIESTYRERFGGISQGVDLSDFPAPLRTADNSETLKPFTEGEVRRALLKMRRNTACGPDGITVGALRVSRHLLTITTMLNVFLLTGKVSKLIQGNRSILLPKGGDPSDLGNWRPLTISSVVLRLFTKLLASRLENAIYLNPRQRGFISDGGSGCADNVQCLDHLIHHAKTEGKTIAVALLDLAKAFDTVSHKHICSGLKRLGVTGHFIGLVEELYDGAQTYFKTPKGITGMLPMTRGVKQGDPLSPILFNVAMDPLFCLIDAEGSSYDLEGTTVSMLAYADDAATVAGSREGLQRNAELAVEFTKTTGMKLNVKKCCAFVIKPLAKRTYAVNDCSPIQLDGTDVPWLTPGKCTKYLGGKVDPWKGFVTPQPLKKLVTWCKRIHKAALKPRQKLSILTQYAITRVMFSLGLNIPSKGSLEELDTLIRKWSRRWLHLNESVNNYMLYARPRDGGLGLPKLAKEVPVAHINNLLSCISSKDDTIRRVAESANFEVKIEETRDLFSLPSWKAARVSNTGWRKQEARAWAALQSQGKGAELWYDDAVSNTWLSPRSFLREREVLTAIALRTNTVPTREALGRADKGRDVRCRRCGSAVETLGHITGACMFVKRNRIKRHNHVCFAIRRSCTRRGWAVLEEPRIVVDHQTFKPDLIVWRDNTAHIIDPTVVWDDSLKSLQTAAEDKHRKYQGIRDAVGKLTSCTEVICHQGFVIGARGTWYKGNNSICEAVGIDAQSRKYICQIVLCGTIKLLGAFMNL